MRRLYVLLSVAVQAAAETDGTALEENRVEVHRVFFQPLVADLNTLFEPGVELRVVGFIGQVDEDSPPRNHRAKEVAERVVRLGRDDVLKVALGLLKAQIVDQVYAPLDARIKAAHRIGGVLAPSGQGQRAAEQSRAYGVQCIQGTASWPNSKT